MKSLWSWLVPEPRGGLGKRALLALVFATLALQAPGQIGIPAIDRDEARYAEATRQMVETHDFVDIKFADQDRFLQPIGIYWLQAASALAFGGKSAGIWAYRLPSLLAVLASVLLTAWFGARLFGAAVGLSAGLILAPSLLVTGEAHLAKIDASLLLATLLAQIALWMTIARKGEGRAPFVGWPLLFWIAIGAGGLLKGPIILLVVGLTILAYGFWQRQWRFVADLDLLLGLLIVAAIIAPWLTAIELRTHGAFLQHALGHSLGYKIAHGEQGHGQPPGYHTLLFSLTFFPGTCLAGLAGFRAWRNRADPFVRFLLCWILPTWILFELVATKLPHYTLPVFPALALLASLGLRDAGDLLTKLAGKIWHGLFGVLFLVAALAVVALPVVAALKLEGRVGPTAIAASLFAAAVLGCGLWLWLRPRPERLLPLVFAMALTDIVLFQLVLPGFAPLWVSDRLGKLAAHLEGCGHISVAAAGFTEPSLVFQLGAATRLVDGRGAADHLGRHPACGIAVVEASQLAGFRAELAAQSLQVQSFGDVTGIDYVNGKPVDLRIFGTQTSALELGGALN